MDEYPIEAWSLNKDRLEFLKRYYFKYNPNSVLEMGSGASTLIALESKIPRFTSLEHDREWLRKNTNMLRARKWDFEITYSEMITYTIPETGLCWRSYDLSMLDPGIEVLFIDGPPKAIGRFGTLITVYQAGLLSSNARILLDDTHRPGDKFNCWIWQEMGLCEIVEHHKFDDGKVITEMIRRDEWIGKRLN